MAAILGNGTITFGDGTTLSSANIPYANITGKKTNLSQFANDLGNYFPFVSISSIDTTPTAASYPGVGTIKATAASLTWDNVNKKLSLTATNCNCACNC